MRSRAVLAPVALLLLTSLLAAACTQSEDSKADPSVAIWQEAQQMQSQLAAKRQSIADLKAQIAAASAAEPAEGETAPNVDEMQAQLAQQQGEASKQAEEFYGKVVEYINASGIVEGQPLSEQQTQAFAWKALEDIAIAQEYIDQGGDYTRAISIIDQALMSDPSNAALLAAKANAERMQYMDEERFKQLKKGMTQDEVRALLGTVNPRNIKEYEDNGTIGWFYPKGEPSANLGAAGVFFKEKKKGEGDFTVTVFDYNAVPPRKADGS